MRVLVLGAKGFIGSAIAAEAVRRGCDVLAVDRGGYAAAVGSACDILINASGNSRKYIDDRDPVRGFELSVASTLHALRDFRFGLFVQVSSGALYPREDDPAQNGEETGFSLPLRTAYGFHKWLAEQLVLQHAPRQLIFRIGGAVGPGLWKNAIYDLLSGSPLFVHPDSELQFIDTRDIARTVLDLCGREEVLNQVFNLCGRGTVSIRQVAQWAGKAVPAEAETRTKVRAELNLGKISAILTPPRTDESVRSFIREIQSGAVALG